MLFLSYFRLEILKKLKYFKKFKKYDEKSREIQIYSEYK